jgi:hypothetical protein
MHATTWNPPANAEAIDTIFASFDGEHTVSGKHSHQSSVEETREGFITQADVLPGFPGSVP